MSITITINDINNLTDMERTLLRLVADNSVAASLRQHVRAITPFEAGGIIKTVNAVTEPVAPPAPINPSEALSPHAQVVEQPTIAAVHAAPTAPTVPNPFAVINPTATPVPASAELDAQGFPWDKRIHSSSRAKVANGNWRYARNLEGSLILAVEEELRATMGAPKAQEPDPMAPVVLPPHLSSAPVVTVAPAPSVPLPPMPTVPVVPVPPAPPAPTGEVTTFAQLMQRITPHIVSTKLSQAHIQATCASLGLPHLAALGARPDLIPAALVALESGVTA